MSKIDKLIQELCPDGVKFKRLDEVATTTIGEFVHKNKQNPDAAYPVYNGGRTETGYYDQYNNQGEKIIISARGAYAGFVNCTTKPYWAGNSSYSISVKSPVNTDWRYIYYFLKRSQDKFTESQQKGGIPAVSKKQVEKFKIPVPPLEVQAEIVKILDTFTQLEAELEAELEARRKQYEFYRNQLLTFNDEGKEKVRWQILESVTVSTGNVKWDKITNSTYKYIDLSSVSRDDHTIVDTVEIGPTTAPSRARKIIATNDIIFATTRPTLKRYTYINQEYDGQIASTGFCVLRADTDKVIPGWILHNIGSSEFNDYVERNQEGSAYPAISDSKVKQFKIPVPPLDEQERIVSILDKFDKLVNDISEGLPAELNARHKQYEYYRTKLLTFQEAKE